MYKFKAGKEKFVVKNIHLTRKYLSFTKKYQLNIIDILGHNLEVCHCNP